MQFSSKEDIEAPVEAVFAMLAEVERYERAAIRRGIDVRRLSGAAETGAGMEWEALFSLRGKPRTMQVRLSELEPNSRLRFDSESHGLTGFLNLELLELSPRRSRMAVVLNLKPNTIPARLLIQSLKLAKANLTRRFKLRVADYARGLEERYRETL
ncbi:SRPBCC family protein [Pukyongiella litopenaei]|uniref:SRPBCC family protein n=1 Tax=Pukyongiella litopenaei TaxID=2605946 RepID=A0A2S0MPB5_9RHOB|nr:SRPBCC family protein [Pukyongiella litopenaei]AVO37739.1 SRPBCC family protein [Pukyongiella litopenaei]